MNGAIKRFARAMLGDYCLYQIYSISAEDNPVPDAGSNRFEFRSVGRVEIDSSTDSLIREQAGYLGTGTASFGCFLDGALVATCHYWYGERYATRNFLPIAPNEAKLVQITTARDVRGQGVASALIAYSAREMFRQGFDALYARIWHSNSPSLRAFEHAGWRRACFVIEVSPFWRNSPVRIEIWKHLRRRSAPAGEVVREHD
ncbi:MAG: GNAT family N-acetyltransferase [Burkholderiales bacterium]|nr:GNAT family N-acetyltransferase [Burkholderiales bacterium]OJX08679.1 MAG: hypothetical protein BGO72_15655 [Burkholderiales bacterium 70-64]